jgi:hypothetical protein
MADQFTIRRKFEDESELLTSRIRAKRDANLDAERERVKRLVRLNPTLFFDPETREILRKVGSQYIFIRHDKRRGGSKRGGSTTVTLKPIAGGLYFDPRELKVYLLRDGHYVLYSKNRRKGGAGKSPTGKERRQGR